MAHGQPEKNNKMPDVNSTVTHEEEVRQGRRFAFGANWQAFLQSLTDERIRKAEVSLRTMLQLDDLRGKTFIDIGSGSGLFSLAAANMGAQVVSFDYDPQSIACTAELRERFHPQSPAWNVRPGSALDREFLATLGQFDLVYSWGVLHHTGQMWSALENAGQLVAPQGKLFIAIYNDQGRSSQFWRQIKRLYCGLPAALRWLVLLPCFARLWGPTLLRDLFWFPPLRTWREYVRNRGMSPWRDVVDWVGGYPFEVAKPEEVLERVRSAGFELTKMTTCGGGLGCNEYVFVKKS